ncbi:hypothetical protein PoB_005941000 [Plakobranchus ocellatus]|uniref:Uncharacterized protein n=1 Tax=Plakobranchus ocellatus TaxID=259542 RepID=A0AAV4CJ53_9GAST|nr:hypothetical protein PoB_005941000 [Plakobranchus ocellatus]
MGNSCTKADKIDSHSEKTIRNQHQNFREAPRVRTRSEERFNARQSRQGWYQSSRPMDNRPECEAYHYTRNNERQNYRRDAQYTPQYRSRNYAPRRTGDC